MNTKTIYLIRHGQTDQNFKKKIQGRKNFPLNDNGRNQALNAGLYFKDNNISIDKIYSSPLDRAYETATIIASINNYNNSIEKDFSFIERNFGEAEGLDITKENFDGVINETYNGLEKTIDLSNRVFNGVLNVINNNKEASNIIIVSHSHTIKGFYKYFDPSYSYFSKMNNCEISIFNYDGFKFNFIKQVDPNNK